MKAANQPALVEWQKGYEFEAARKASFAAAINGTPLFEQIPDLRLLEFTPLFYPPLARQTRISGDVKLRIVVDETGHVSETTTLSGHPLLQQAALDAVRSWEFVPMSNSKEFEIVCTFGFSGKLVDYWSDVTEQTSVVGSQHIQVISDGMTAQNAYAEVGS